MRFVVEWLIFIPLLLLLNFFIFDIHNFLDIRVAVIIVFSLVFILSAGSSFFIVFAGRKKNLEKEKEKNKK